MLLVAAGLGAVASALACGDASAPSSRVDRPAAVSAVAVRVNAVNVLWTPVSTSGVVAYRLERREDLRGRFTTIVPRIEADGALEQLAYLDVDVQPETFYGYRLRAINGAGEESSPSTIAGARTPPSPAIDVITTTELASSAAADPNGYEVRITGPETASSALGASARRRFPLPVGQYEVSLDGLVSRCTVQGPASRPVTLSDTGMNTVVPVNFPIVCSDPNRGRIVVAVATTGEDQDNSYTAELLGLAADASLPESERVVTRQQQIEGANGLTSFGNLRPGSYQVTLTGIERNCGLTGTAVRDVPVTAASLDTVRYVVACEGESPPPPPPGRPLVLRNSWMTASAAPGARVVLRMMLDATMRPAYRVSAVQTELRYDPAVVRIDSVKPVLGGMTLQDWGTVPSAPGVILHVAQELAGLGGNITVSDFHFTVVGAAGTRAITRTTVSEIVDATSRLLTDSTYAVDDTLQVSGTAPGPNQPPTARANGPYTGTAGSPVAFSAAGSSDPEGGPLTYAWAFGDGAAGTGASPTRTYAAAGTYTVVLTVTDDRGASAIATTTATVSSADGGARPFIWSYAFGAVNPSDSVVIMTVTYDLTPNLEETAGPEALQAWTVDSLRWNPAILKLYAFNFGSGATGSVNSTFASQGKLAFNGTIPQAQSAGLLTIATIRFKVVGTSGQSTQTRTALGPLIGQPSTGPFVYNAKTTIIERTFTAP